MTLFKCKMCGGTIKFGQDAFIGICDSCGSEYTFDEAEEMMEEDTTEVKSTAENKHSDYVENLYEMARNAKDEDNPELAVDFYRSLTIYDKYNWEPLFYYNYFKAIHYDSLEDLTDSLGKVFYFIDRSEKSADEKWDVVQEITERIDAICDLFVQKKASAVAKLQVKTADLLEKYFADKSLDIVTSYLKSSVANYLELDSSDRFTLVWKQEVKTIEDRIKKMDSEYESILPILKLLDTLVLHDSIFPEEYSEEFWLAIKYHINTMDSKYASKVKHLTDSAQKRIIQSIKINREFYRNEEWEEHKKKRNKSLAGLLDEELEQIKEYVELGKRLHENNQFQNANNINKQEMPKDKQKRNDALEKTNSNASKPPKKKTGIICISAVIAIVALIVAFSTFGTKVDSDIVGTWRAEHDSSVSITFKDNGDMIVRSANAVDDGLSYKIDGNNVIVTFANDDTETYGFVVEGDTLIFGEYYYSKIE